MSYLSLLSWQYKLQVLITVFFFTIMLPSYMIGWYRRYRGWSHKQMSKKENRIVPYIIVLVCYVSCYILMNVMRIPRYMGNILLVSLVIQMTCAIVNIFWKISTHCAGVGAVVGALIAFSIIFDFNPVGWLCLAIIVSGIVGSSRMILRQHTLSQVLAGFTVGLLISCNMLLFV